jgi:hypothetical protein
VSSFETSSKITVITAIVMVSQSGADDKHKTFVQDERACPGARALAQGLRCANGFGPAGISYKILRISIHLRDVILVG